MTRTLLVILVPLLVGCGNDGNQAANGLTAELAKQSLCDVQVPPGVMIPPPKDEPIEVIGLDEIAIGVWRCNLKQRTFHATAEHPASFHHKFNAVSGVFERSPDGKWVAKVTRSQSGG